MNTPGFTAARSLRGVSAGSRASLGVEDAWRLALVVGSDPPARLGERAEGGIVPASYWGWLDGSCGWDCSYHHGRRPVRAVLYDIPWGWDWDWACRIAVGFENRTPDSCKVGLFGPPPGWVVEGQWWIPWANSN